MTNSDPHLESQTHREVDFFGEMMIYPRIHALAGCVRRCAVLILGGIGLSSTQHRVGVASFRSEQQYLYGIATIFRFRAQVMSQLWAVLRFSYLGPPRCVYLPKGF